MPHRKIIGDFYENKISWMFHLIPVGDSKKAVYPDRMERDESFYVEAKASFYKNGGVINLPQLERFSALRESEHLKFFYSFGYHTLKDIKKIILRLMH